MALLSLETRRLIQDDPDLFKVSDEPADFVHQEPKWFEFVNRASNQVLLHYGNYLLGRCIS